MITWYYCRGLFSRKHHKRFCSGIVIRVGDKTVVGRIRDITSRLSEKGTILSKSVTLLVLTFTCVGLVVAMVFWVEALRLDYPWSDATLFFVGICIAIVPESMLFAITVCHTVAGNKMMRKGCIAKHFDAIENLGATSVICFDKTGTLTENILSVGQIWTHNGIYNVNSNVIQGLNKNEGEEETEAKNNEIENIEDHTELNELFKCINLSNTASFSELIKKKSNDYSVVAERIDLVLLKFVVSNLESAEELRNSTPKVHEVPFNYKNFYQYSIYQQNNEGENETFGAEFSYRIVFQGAPEKIFKICSTQLVGGKDERLQEAHSTIFHEMLNEMGTQGQRVLGFCDVTFKSGSKLSFEENVVNYPVSNCRFLGLVSLLDPPRPSAADTVSKLRSSNMKVIMLTGDHSTTALSIAKSVGITSIVPLHKKTGIFTGSELKLLVKSGNLDTVLTSYQELIFSRVSPDDKSTIVSALQKQGELVTMVGDGINDCVALRTADNSIAMGMNSSDAAKEVADIVLQTNNLSSILGGVKSGRLVFENLKKCFAFTITSNIPIVFPFIFFIVFGIPLPLNPMSIFFLTFGVDMFPAIALACENPEWDLVRDSTPAKIMSHNIFNRKILERAYARVGVIQLAAGMFSYSVVLTQNGFEFIDILLIKKLWYSPRIVTDSHGQEWTLTQREYLENTAQSAYFFAIVINQLTHLICCKTRRKSIFQHGFKNWKLDIAIVLSLGFSFVIVNTRLLHISKHDFQYRQINWRWLVPGIPFAVLIFIYDEIRKLIIRRHPNSWLGNYLYY